jgi:hypothetical protein
MTSLTQMKQEILPASNYLGILLRREFAESRGWYSTFAVIWFVGLWILPIFDHPGYLVFLGLLLVFLRTASQVGIDVLDGTEEFTFTQPPTRADVFLSRMLPTAIFLLISGVVGSLAIAFNLPQMLWSICFSGGLVEPFRPVMSDIWYPMAALLPLTSHVLTGGIAAEATSRNIVGVAGVAGLIGAFLIAALVYFLDLGQIWFSILLPFSFVVGVSNYSLRAYQRKEATRAGATTLPAQRRGFGWLWVIILFVVVLFVYLSFMKVSAIQQSERSRAIENEIRNATPDQP